MHTLFAIAALLLCQLAGEIIVQALGIALPGPLIGMALMLLGLILLGRLPLALKRSTHVLLAHLMLLFIPSIVAVMTHGDIIRSEWLPFIAACLGGTAITLLVTATTLKLMLARAERKPS